MIVYCFKNRNSHQTVLGQIESNSRPQNKSQLKIEICVGKGKTLWEKEKMPVTSIFSFTHKVLKCFFKSRDSVEKS